MRDLKSDDDNQKGTKVRGEDRDQETVRLAGKRDRGGTGCGVKNTVLSLVLHS